MDSLALYGLVTGITLWIGFAVWAMGDGRSKRNGARVMLFAPLWPAVWFLCIANLIVRAVRDADLFPSNETNNQTRTNQGENNDHP